MKARTKRFDAVVESRKWKESVAQVTGGMTPEETVAHFQRETVRRRFEAALQQAERTRKPQER